MTKTHIDFKDGKGPVPAHSHPNGKGWVADTATVDKTAYVGPDAYVFGQARIHGHVQVFGQARIHGHAYVFGQAQVYGHAQVYGQARVYVPVDFDCDFDPWALFQRILLNKEILPTLMHVDPDLDKIISQKLG